MKHRKTPPAEIDEQALDTVRAGSDKSYVVTQVEHTATQTEGQRFFAGVVNRISQ